MTRALIISLSLSLPLTASFGFSRPDAQVLECDDFQKIFRFVQDEHLRFRSETPSNIQTLTETAIQSLPNQLREEGLSFLAANFERLDKKSQLMKVSGNAGKLCRVLGHSVYRSIFLKAFTEQLDPYSEFYLSEETERQTSVVDGHFVGVGIGTKLSGEFVEVTEVVEGGPSDTHLFIGDRITHIDNFPVRGLGAMELRKRIRGDLNTSVKFSGTRKEEPFAVSIVRSHVFQKSVSHRLSSDGFLTIKIHRFFTQTAPQIRDLLALYPRVKGIILDLRDNPGGLLQAARDVVDLFVSVGVVVHLRGAHADQLWAFQEGGNLKTPLVALVNEKTASASEIVAGALQDYGRAVLVGRPTFGKSCVQNIYNTRIALGTKYEGGLKLTTLWFYLPSGRSVVSLKPDVELPSTEPAVARTEFPYAWPQTISVPRMVGASPQIRELLMRASHGASKTAEGEEIGRNLLRQMTALSQ